MRPARQPAAAAQHQAGVDRVRGADGQLLLATPCSLHPPPLPLAGHCSPDHYRKGGEQ